MNNFLSFTMLQEKEFNSEPRLSFRNPYNYKTDYVYSVDDVEEAEDEDEAPEALEYEMNFSAKSGKYKVHVKQCKLRTCDFTFVLKSEDKRTEENANSEEKERIFATLGEVIKSFSKYEVDDITLGDIDTLSIRVNYDNSAFKSDSNYYKQLNDSLKLPSKYKKKFAEHAGKKKILIYSNR